MSYVVMKHRFNVGDLLTLYFISGIVLKHTCRRGEVMKYSKEKHRLPPYLTYATWQRLIDSLRQYTPLRLDRTHLMDLGFSQSTALTVKASLSFLELIDPNSSEPTDRLLALLKAEGEDYRALLREMVKTAYQPVLGNLDLERATLGQVQECFRRFGAVGNVGHKCLSFFLALAKDAGIPLSPNLLTKSRLGAVQKVVPAVLSARSNRASSSLPKRQSAKTSGAGSGYFATKLPDFDPGWPKEVREEWFNRFQTLVVLIDKFPPFNAEWSDELKVKWFDFMKGFLGSTPLDSTDS